MMGQLWTLLMASLLMVQQTQAFGWANKNQGVTSCSLAGSDLQKITDMFMEGSNTVNISMVELDVKLQKVLDLVVALQSQDDKLLQRTEDEAPLEHLNADSVESDNQGEEKIVEEQIDKEISEEQINKEHPKQESLTDTLELHKYENDQQKQESSVERSEHQEEETLNENTLLDETLSNDNEIDLFISPANNKDVKKGGCKALVHNAHDTIGMFYITSYRHGHCANRNPLTTDNIRYCLGYCTSKTFLDREAGHEWSQGHECYSCQPDTMEEVSIPLECENGYTFHKKYRNVVSCKCKPCKPSD